MYTQDEKLVLIYHHGSADLRPATICSVSSPLLASVISPGVQTAEAAAAWALYTMSTDPGTISLVVRREFFEK
ncbi:hypothetical protein V492_07996 [Pseudogymnoascus sp. VKM F-4246]|nr:hypothetical protein V492_07996 [Pseudogymnoascus sp. VKM F-4246]